MKSSLLISTGDQALIPATWNAFTQVATGTFANLAASVVPNAAIPLLAQAQQGGSYPNLSYVIPVPVPMPAWLQPGVGIKIAMSVASGNGVSLNISGYYVVKAINASGAANHNIFTVDAPSSPGGRDAAAITRPGSYACDSATGGAVANPVITLVAQCQKAVFKATAGTVIIAPGFDTTGTASFPITLEAGQTPEQDFRVTAQPGMKFDLGDWSVMTGSAGTLAVMFI